MLVRYRYAIAIIAILFVFAAIGAIIVSRRPEAPEIAIPRLLADIEQAVERGNTSGVLQIVSREYSDSADNTYRDIARLVRGGMYYGEHWVISSQILSLQASDNTADVRIRVIIYPLADQKATTEYEISSIWRLEGRAWRVISASGWQDIEPRGI